MQTLFEGASETGRRASICRVFLACFEGSIGNCYISRQCAYVVFLLWMQTKCTFAHMKAKTLGK